MKNQAAPAARRYRFADLTLDVGRRHVLRGDAALRLSKLSFDLLRVLVESAPNAVPHEQLANRVWGPRRVVTPENLAKRVMLLRQALDDRADHSRYIEGLRGHGYRLIPGVHVEPEASSDPLLEARLPSDAHPPQSPAADVTGSETLEAAPAHLVAAASAAPVHAATRRNVLVGALAVAVGGLAVDDFRLRRARRHAGRVEAARERPHTFELYAPRSSSFGAAPTDPQPALGPGGRELAFVAPSEWTDALWVQTLGSLEARPLRGTERASWPFWSADGRFVGFATNREVMRVAAAGGASPTAVAELDGAYWGGAWADDTVLFAGRAGLYRVPASGGKPVLWTDLDASAGEFSHRFPVLLPDGRRFVYLALSTRSDRMGFYLGSLDDRGMKRWLRPGHSKAAVARGVDGRPHLLFVGEYGELLAQPFDASLTVLVGEAVEIAPASTVEVNGGVCAGALTASGRTLVYRPRVSARTRLLWRDRVGTPSEAVMLPDGAYRNISLSHDGTMLAVERDALDPASGLWLIDGRRNQNRRLGVGHTCAWTRDDSRVVYADVRPEGWRVYMKQVAADTAAEPVVAGSYPFVKRVRDVAGNGLLFQCAIAGGARLYYSPLTGGEEPTELRVAYADPVHARVSPNEQWLAFSATDAGETHVFVTRFPDLGETVRVSTLPGADPQWRRDGRELYYVSVNRTLMALEVTPAADRLDFGSPVPLFHAPFDSRSLELSSAYASAPDGRRFIVAEADEEPPRLRVTSNWDARA